MAGADKNETNKIPMTTLNKNAENINNTELQKEKIFIHITEESKKNNIIKPITETTDLKETVSPKEDIPISEISLKNETEMLNSNKSPPRGKPVKKKKKLIENPSSMVQKFQIALYNKIKEYGDGKGTPAVWMAIDQELKEILIKTETREGKPVPRMKYDTFRKSVDRLKEETPIYELMSFGIQGNIILMMNIFEILGVKSISDLLKTEPAKPDIVSITIKSNLLAEETIEKLNKLKDVITLSMKNKPRISNLKVCRDWEQILGNMSWIINLINPKQIQEEKNEKGNISGDPSSAFSYNVLNNYTNQYNNEIQLALNTRTLLYQYKEYFPQNLSLHNFIEGLGHLSRYEYNRENKLIKIAPLYLLYFFFLFQKKFINIFIHDNTKSKRINCSPFVYSKITPPNEKMEDIDKSYNDPSNLITYIRDKNNEMLSETKNILELINDNIIELIALQNNSFNQLICKIIKFFINIYSSQVNYDNNKFLEILERINNLDDLYEQLSLGKPLIYHISEENINDIADFAQKLKGHYRSLSRSKE